MRRPTSQRDAAGHPEVVDETSLYPDVDDGAREAEVYDEHGIERYPDAEQAELDRRHAEALEEWRDNPRARTAFAVQVGQVEHADWQGELRRIEAAAGRTERRHDGTGEFGIEYPLDHPDGGKVRYDYVDFEAHQIVDRKPLRRGEGVNEVARRYADQSRRHVEAYHARFGANPDYHYSFYPSVADLDRSEDE